MVNEDFLVGFGEWDREWLVEFVLWYLVFWLINVLNMFGVYFILVFIY